MKTVTNRAMLSSAGNNPTKNVVVRSILFTIKLWVYKMYTKLQQARILQSLKCSISLVN